MRGRPEVYEGPEERILDLVLSRNLARRHLNTSQRALVAEKMANLLERQNKSASGLKIGQQTSIEEAARIMNVSKLTVDQAAAVLKEL